MRPHTNFFQLSPVASRAGGIVNALIGAGYDVTVLGAVNDSFTGGPGNDAIYGGAGQDALTGGLGDDILVGGADGDSYVFTAYTGVSGFGHDVIIDHGQAGTWDNQDSIVLNGTYVGTGIGAGAALPAVNDMAALSFSRVGQDMVIAVDGGASSITVKGALAPGDSGIIETVQVNDQAAGNKTFQVIDGAQTSIGNDRDHTTPQHSVNNELLFGTDAGEGIYGGTGTNFIWTGAGADTLIFQVNDATLFGTQGGGDEVDIVEDFDVAQDMLDFSAVGTTYVALDVSADEVGDAVITWHSFMANTADISVELRGVAAVDVSADFFIF